MKVVEIFKSINGEGPRSGVISLFIRFKGCNLKCSYCDTMYANDINCKYVDMSIDEIVSKVEESHVKHITITGGEPLLQKDLLQLLKALKDYEVEIETNGSMDISIYQNDYRPYFTLDYKLPSSLYESFMNVNNYKYLIKGDAVKFVCGDINDLHKAKEIIYKYELTIKCKVYLSAVFNKITYEEIVNYMLEYNMNDVYLQLQMHKYIWDPNLRGV